MSERKVLNKYYPPDFDQSKLPKLKRGKDRQFVIRIMAPFSMRCTTCGEYIYKGRKFNSRMETVLTENYLGLRIYRFYIRCTKCISEITFKTDPKSSDYIMEHGATRNFESLRRLQEKIARENKEDEEEEIANPMKALENRTRDSKREMESVEKLEELRDKNTRAAAIDPEKMIEDHLRTGQQIVETQIQKQEEEDEELVRQIFGKSGACIDGYIRRIIDDGSSSESDTDKPGTSSSAGDKRKATDFLVNDTEEEPFASSLSPTTTVTPSGFGPTPDPATSKKAKLKTPFDDLASMVKVKSKKKKKKEPKIEKPKEEEDVEEKQEVNEPTPLPAYKINLKKQTDSGKAKIKGASLSMLGGYGSVSDSSSDGD